jgi:hypothetical protein
MSNPPVQKFHIGLVNAAVWKNDKFFSVTLSRNYKDADDKWQQTDQLGATDLLNGARLLQRCEEWISRQA